MNKLSLIVLLFQAVLCNSQVRYENKIVKNTIQTVLFYREGWDFSYPVLRLNSDDRLILMFDDLDSTYKVKKYSFSIIHCNAKWEPDNLPLNYYTEGYPDSQINDYKFSNNTFCRYINYKTQIPNQDIKILKSGNYILKVFENYDEENIVMIRKFYVIDKKINIQAKIRQPLNPDYVTTGQQIDFTLNCNKLQPHFNPEYVKVNIIQNNRNDNTIYNLRPKYINGTELNYDYDKENIINGGGEFRHFDIKNVRVYSEKIDSIFYISPYFHFHLIIDESIARLPYSFHPDLNGKFLVKTDNSISSENEADYVYVHFRLKYPYKKTNGSMFVFGQLSDWNYLKANEMRYNYDTGMYELTLFLKQGYYNYQYMFVKTNETIGDESIIEGTYYETENDYLILVYYYDISENIDKLVGFEALNSLKRY